MLLFVLLFSSCRNNADIKTILLYDGEMTIDHAHPNAQELLVNDFYWSSMEETGPFGSDAGSDAFYGYRAWRRTNIDKSPVEYLRKFYANWNLKQLDLQEHRDSVIIEYINSENINGMILVDTDNAAISVGFGQFMLEGKMDHDIKHLVDLAITRERKSILLEQFAPNYVTTRQKHLEEMALILEKMDSYK